MNEFGRFYLDKEKDISVDLTREGGTLSYVLRTPNHGTGRLIRNLAALCRLPLSRDAQGLFVIRGTIPCYVDGDNRRVYVFRLADTKIANIYPDGTVERKATIPAIAKTLMSQTKDYTLGAWHTIVKSYILEDVKFRTDLHTHMNANLPPDVLIALGIWHQVEYPLYYIKKLGLRLTRQQELLLAGRRARAEAKMADSPLVGKYRERRIDDATVINFAALILKNRRNAAYNLAQIRNSLAVMKDGQAVFTNLEKVYLYRYVFTKGKPSAVRIPLTGLEHIPDPDIAAYVRQMAEDHDSDAYRHNTLFQDKLLWIARHYRDCGITYAEISDTTLVKKSGAAGMLAEVHEVMPKVTAETGVTLRFLAALRRIPLTIVQDKITPNDYLRDNLRVIRAVAGDPYVAGSDIVGEEINDIRELAPVIRCLVKIAGENPGYVLRIHAGENDTLTDNVANSVKLVEESLAPGQPLPHVRIGHGLYTANLKSRKGRALAERLVKDHVVLEFQLSSNVRLNNLSDLSRHPLKSHLKAGILCVQGTDGGALYGTDSMDEQIALERMLELSHDDLARMCEAERRIIRDSLRTFRRREEAFEAAFGAWREGAAGPAPAEDDALAGLVPAVKAFYEDRIAATPAPAEPVLVWDRKKYDAARELRAQTKPLPAAGLPVIVAGGSFHAERHQTVVTEEDRRLIDRLLAGLDPAKAFFVVGHRVSGQERYLLEANAGRFPVFAFVPTKISLAERNHLIASNVSVRISIEETNMSLYKSIAYEVFRRRPSVLVAFDGNSAGANLVQEAKNARFPAAIFVSRRSRTLSAKASTLAGYASVFGPEPSAADRILARCAELMPEAVKGV